MKLVKSCYDEYARSLERAPGEVRGRTVGASEIGQCMRKVHWRKRGGEVDEGHRERYGAHLRGTLIERHLWLPAMRARYGGDLLFAGDDQRAFELGMVSATPDGLVVRQPAGALAEYGVEDCGGCFVVECKSIDPRTHLREAKAENVFQVQLQLGLIRDCTEWQPEWALVSYTDASFVDEVSEYAVQFDPAVYEVAKARAAQVLTARSGAELLPEGYIAGGRECDWCPHTRICGLADRPPADGSSRGLPIEAQFVAEVMDLCRQLLHVRQDAADAEEEVKWLQALIKDRLRAKGLRKVPHVVTWSSVKGRNTVDMAALRQVCADAGIVVEEFSSAGEPTDRLTVAREVEALGPLEPTVRMRGRGT